LFVVWSSRVDGIERVPGGDRIECLYSTTCRGVRSMTVADEIAMSYRFATMCRATALVLAASVFVFDAADAAEPPPLPSWNEGPVRKVIVDFVGRVTREGGADFVAPAERIATFDNDGTLWCEQPMYVQAVFAFDRARGMAERDPALKEK